MRKNISTIRIIALFQHDIPEYGEIMDVSSFIEHCKSKGFTDWDGDAHMIIDGKILVHRLGVVRPSDIIDEEVTEEYFKNNNCTEIIWYNR